MLGAVPVQHTCCLRRKGSWFDKVNIILGDFSMMDQKSKRSCWKKKTSQNTWSNTPNLRSFLIPNHVFGRSFFIFPGSHDVTKGAFYPERAQPKWTTCAEPQCFTSVDWQPRLVLFLPHLGGVFLELFLW